MTAAPDLAALPGDDFLARAEAFVIHHQLPGLAVGVVRGQELVWSAGVGMADLDSLRPVDADTVFQIASVTKTFTATAILQLRDAQLLRLDDPLQTYVPEFAAVDAAPGISAEVTLRHLLQHCSGLQGETPSTNLREAPNITQAEVISSLGRARILERPGTAFRYSNLGFRLLAEVVARVGGSRWPDYATEHILRPLGMNSSGSFLTGEVAARRAQGYLRGVFEDRPAATDAVPAELAEGDGDLWSSVNDLARWVALQLGAGEEGHPRSAVLEGSSLLEMHRPTTVASDSWSEMRCLGWGAVRRDWGVLICHGGLLNGYNSHACFSTEEQLGVVALTNGLGRASVGDLAWELMDLAVAGDRSAKILAAAVVRPALPVPAGWRELLGRYLDVDDGEELLIEHRGGRLVCTDSARTSFSHLEPGSEPLAFRVHLEDWVFLRSEADGTIDGLNVRGYPFVRIPT